MSDYILTVFAQFAEKNPQLAERLASAQIHYLENLAESRPRDPRLKWLIEGAPVIDARNVYISVLQTGGTVVVYTMKEIHEKGLTVTVATNDQAGKPND